VAFLGDGDPDPKFLWFATTAPHLPAIYAPRHADAFPDASGLDRDRLRTLLAVDEAFVAMYQALGERAERAIWIVVSDNGFLIDEHGVEAGKNVPYDAAHRVTALVRIPGVPPGTDDRITANIDLFATVLTAAGYPVPDNDGRAWQDAWQRDGILIEGWGSGGNRSVYKGIWTPQFTYLERRRPKHKHTPPLLWDRTTSGEGINVLTSENHAAWTTWLDALATCKGAGCRDAESR
jgi:arylsulfatase A-like enzyme